MDADPFLTQTRDPTRAPTHGDLATPAEGLVVRPKKVPVTRFQSQGGAVTGMPRQKPPEIGRAPLRKAGPSGV